MSHATPVESVAPPRPSGLDGLDFRVTELALQELFEQVDLQQIMPLLADCPTRILEPGEVLIEVGRPNHNMFLLLSGQLSIRLESAGSVPITFVVPGQSVGELSVIDHQPTSAYVVAELESRVLVIDEELLWILINSSHAVSSNLLYILVRRLRYGNEVIARDRERLEQYRFHATVDELTGLFNRHWLATMLPRLMHRAARQGDPLGLLMIDVDEFKQFNDRYGHLTGDQVIVGVAHRIRDGVRPMDMAVRYGGDEFLVILPGCRMADAGDVGQRLREAVAAPVVSHRGVALSPVTLSVGVTEMRPEDTVDAFIERADQALYQAKRSGRDTVVGRRPR
ncbi:MAG: GGDEF domain-containing protein [Ectothiorhodospiraceae bacterium]|nr:GGDEF domain-containing protein [Ectothiorhodospiraceae bacterium]